MTNATEILKKPYARVVVPESDGTFRAEIHEFPGCIAVGETAAQALSLLEEVAESWLESALANRHLIPEPIEIVDYSGKLVLRLPKSLHSKAAFASKRDGVSLNQYISTALAVYIGSAEAKVQAVHGVTVNVTGINVNSLNYTDYAGIGAPVWRSLGLVPVLGTTSAEKEKAYA